MKVGIDSVIIKRFKKMKRLKSFLTKYFTDYEIGYIVSKKSRYQTIAGIFAAKEAFLKAFQIGIGNGVSLKSIEVKHNNNGAPFINLGDNLKMLIDEHGIKNISISITHTKKTATAICIIN